MIIAYSVYGQDNDSYIDSQKKRCKVCGAKIEFDINTNITLNNTTYDMSYTLDGYMIVSKRIKDFCEKENLKNIEFHCLDNFSDFFCLKVTKVLNFDFEKRKTRFLNKCDSCGTYEEVIGATPAFLLLNNKEIKNGIYRTDIEFGHKSSRHPLIIFGTNTYKKLLILKVRGLDGDKIVS
jgi:hypothetical protein